MARAVLARIAIHTNMPGAVPPEIGQAAQIAP